MTFVSVFDLIIIWYDDGKWKISCTQTTNI